MNRADDIVRDGIVDSVRQGKVFISVSRTEGCSGCSARAACNISECGGEELLEIPEAGRGFVPGERVKVSMASGIALKTAFISYLLPLVLMVVLLLTLIECGMPEALAGLCSVLVLIPYYAVLSWYARGFRKRLTFYITRP